MTRLFLCAFGHATNACGQGKSAFGPHDFFSGRPNFCTAFTCGRLISNCPGQPWRPRTPHHMALSQSIGNAAAQPLNEPRAQRNNVIPFPTARVRLQVILPHRSCELPGTQLRVLLHSPLGVYVVATEAMRQEIRVQLDIAFDDLDFTLHTLISTLPAAMIGPLKRRSAVAKAR
ncbi:hypothetical protein [Paraburkholderia xenovorans]|uniref:Uncharacterized protein n=1 Tax=Paraburkholderia xenovorans (strain LB400) TaxID=266265 RepID=Q13J44_PARXL|nr:hypothetical protein [Paraburkholderia xenovorans]ABE35895.1 hypothetical protein Bxe_B0030 [Paraburkholderia xenovorans LB400]